MLISSLLKQQGQKWGLSSHRLHTVFTSFVLATALALPSYSSIYSMFSLYSSICSMFSQIFWSLVIKKAHGPTYVLTIEGCILTHTFFVFPVRSEKISDSGNRFIERFCVTQYLMKCIRNFTKYFPKSPSNAAFSYHSLILRREE